MFYDVVEGVKQRLALILAHIVLSCLFIIIQFKKRRKQGQRTCFCHWNGVNINLTHANVCLDMKTHAQTCLQKHTHISEMCARDVLDNK